MKEVKEGFSRFLDAVPDRLHAAAHSHHPWPDVGYTAHLRAWDDAARLMDDKWDLVFGKVFPSARRRIASRLGLGDPETIVFAPNTHELLIRIASTLPTPLRILTSDAEFHSFARQATRWEEAGEAEVTRVSAQPFGSFPERLVAAYDGHHLTFFSHVHFDSGYVVPDLEAVVGRLPEETTVVVDGYHGFMAVPTDLASLSGRAFYLAGGYKYAMAGEGACFLHVPPTADARPVNTGWWGGFGALTDRPDSVPYTPGGQRYGGATFDPSGVYRLDASLGWLDQLSISVEAIHGHVRDLQTRLLQALGPGWSGDLVPGANALDRGHFLTFARRDASLLYRRLHDEGVITDHRGDRWRVGLGIYHDIDDIDRLAEHIRSAGKGT